MSQSYFLAKGDPEDYGLDHLERDGRTAWSGVRNPQAVRTLRSMNPGDVIFLYHSGGESAVVGLAHVVSDPYDDPKDTKSAIVDFAFTARLPEAVTLREIKEIGLFNDWALVRQSRLSTMPAPENFVAWMRKKFPKLKI